jgi:hypothetical protein
MTDTMVAGLCYPSDARSCSICACGDPLLAASDPAAWLFVRGQLPFNKNLDGEQDVKPSVSAGLQYQAL